MLSHFLQRRFLHYLLLSILLCAFLLSTSQTASACSCGRRSTVLEEFDESDEVVIVRAISVEKVESTDEHHYVDNVRSTTMVVEKVFKGNLKVRDEIVFGQGGGADCIWTFDEKSVGHQFLFYLKRPDKLAGSPYLPSKDPGLWFAFGCGRSGGLSVVTDDLLYLESIKKVRGKTRISGTIGGWQNPDIDVEGKRIKIIGSKKTYVTKTDKDGVFEIYGLPPGKYFVEPEIPPGWKIDSYWLKFSPSVAEFEYWKPELKSPKQVEIVLEPKKHAGVNIVFELDNFVRGRVLDPTANPMSRVCVYLLRPGQEGWGPSDCTDEQGRFEIRAIPEGQYVLVANQDGKPSDREPFGKIFYPNVSERGRAAVITIGPGEIIDNIEMVIPKLEETITIEGVLRYSDGKPAVEDWVRFKVTKADDRVNGNVDEQTDSAGRFTLKVLKGLTGELAGEEWISTGLYKNCPIVDELLAKGGGNNVTVKSNVINLTTEQNLYDVELTFPFPRCKRVKE